MKGPFGYGRYDDDPEHVGCPRAKSDMTPCIARDGAVAQDDGRVCVGCGNFALDLLAEINGTEYVARAAAKWPGDGKFEPADLLKEAIKRLTEPASA